MDYNVSHIPSTTNTPSMPSTATATTAASNTTPTPSPDLDLTDLLHMPENGLIFDLNFNIDFLNISSNMAAVFPNMVGMQPFALGYYGDAAGPPIAVYALDLGLPVINVL
ncbi:hypothetical protein B0H14DRAFT_3879734 [Mycena olivaceomarginata]|nr:hypothetical protein B0H14DRAFT_3879734 [Mycena olivaceomarginata]